MAQSKLNVLLGLDISAFSRSIAQASNKMEQFGKRMESIGGDLTTRLTLPLVGVGAAAVTAFADLEKLEKGMVAIMGSTEAASAEFIRLREVAKLPGLGLKEAVQGSVNLQAVGLSAEEARNTMLGFGKALAATGGGRVDLEAIQYQLTQMISKNKLLAEDYKVIQSRLPLMAKGMEAAFGTSNIENIRAAGIGAKEFVMRLVQGLNSLPQTQNVIGGLANAFENFGDNVFIAGSQFGEAINESLGLESILKSLSDFVQNLSDGFTNLSPTTQKVIVVLAGVAAAIGPILLGVGALVKIIPLLISGFTLMTGPIGLAVIGITALAGVLLASTDTFRKYNAEQSKAAAVQQKLGEVTKEAESRAAEQKTQVDILVNALKKENISYEEKARILGELKTISPEYFGNLKNTATAAADAEVAQKAFNDELLRTIQIEVAREKLVELERQLQNVAKESKPTIFQGFINAFKSGGNVITAASLNAKTYGQNIKSNTAAIEAQRRALLDLINAEKIPRPQNGGGGGGGSAAVSGLSIPRIDSTQQAKVFAQIEKDAFEKFGNARKAVEGFNSTLAAIPDVKTPMDGIKNALKDMQKQLQDTDITMKIFGGTTEDILKSKLSLLENGIAEGIRLYGEESLLVQGLIEQYKKLKGEIEEITLAQENRKKLEEAVGGAIREAGGIISQSISEQGASLKKLGQAALESAKLIIKSLIQEGVAGYIRNILAGPTGKALGPIALGVAAAGGTIAAGIFSAAVGKIGVPRLAQGGLATKETLAVVGDNPSGKEAIIPFERMGEFLDMAGGGAMRLVGQFEVRGQDLVLVLDRATQQKLRVR